LSRGAVVVAGEGKPNKATSAETAAVRLAEYVAVAIGQAATLSAIVASTSTVELVADLAAAIEANITALLVAE